MTGRPENPTSRTYFGQRLREAQKEAGMSNSQVAREADISESLLAKYRRGDQTPGLANASRLARALNVPLDYFADPEELVA